MQYIWILDCCSGVVTKVNLSPEREKELLAMDSYDFLAKYADEFRISLDDSDYMVTTCGNIDEIDF